jgi:hypothetical protein
MIHPPDITSRIFPANNGYRLDYTVSLDEKQPFPEQKTPLQPKYSIATSHETTQTPVALHALTPYL